MIKSVEGDRLRDGEACIHACEKGVARARWIELPSLTPDHEYVWKEKFLLERDNNDELRKDEDLGFWGLRSIFI